MAVPGRLHGANIGPYVYLDRFAGQSATTYAMAALNTGHCARFTATQNKDIASVKVNFSSVSAAGEITLRIETIDATTGKPSGTLYDANASKAFTPVAGWQTVTFDSVPTTNLTVGAEYGVVLLTTTGGTTMTLRSSLATGTSYPNIVLTAADGTTRSNFAEQSAQPNPIGSFLLDDATEDPMGLIPYATETYFNIYGTNAIALKLVVDGTVSAYGVAAFVGKDGTPAGDLRVRILNTAGSAVSNSTVTVDKDSLLTGLTAHRRCNFMFGGLVSLASGTYYVTFDSASSANSSNSWIIASAVPCSTGVVPDGYIASTTTDVTAGPPPTWTDSGTGNQPLIRVLVDDITAAAGGVGQPASQMLNGMVQR